MNYSIISDNCWGTGVYTQYGGGFHSPFINLFIHTPYFIKLCYNFENYINEDLKFLAPTASKFNPRVAFPVAILGDVEICFSHYKIGEEKKVQEDWERRKKRINMDQLLFKCGGLYEPGCKKYEEELPDLMEKFHNAPVQRKLSFTVEKYEYDNNFRILKSEEGDAYKLGLNVKKYLDIERFFS